MTTSPPSPEVDTIAFAEKLLALLDQGLFTATYKYAVLLGLIDLCLEGFTAAGAPPDSVTTTQLAEVIARLYWPQVLPFEEVGNGVLRQNTTGQAEIVALVAKARGELAGGGAATLERVRRQAPDAYRRLVRSIEWKLVEMPLPRLQTFGRQADPFIYEINWDTRIKRSEFNDPNRFANVIRFRPGVANHLVRLDGLLRPLLYRGWAAQVAAINQLAESNLERHLFGIDRAALRPVMKGLTELQHGRCLYCAGKLAAPQVDHFLPWARVPLDAIENLVVADDSCNHQKRDLLAAADHVEHWRERLDGDAQVLAAIADGARWETSPQRTLGVARALYLPLPAGARLWSNGSALVLADPQRLRSVLR